MAKAKEVVVRKGPSPALTKARDQLDRIRAAGARARAQQKSSGLSLVAGIVGSAGAGAMGYSDSKKPDRLMLGPVHASAIAVPLAFAGIAFPTSKVAHFVSDLAMPIMGVASYKLANGSLVEVAGDFNEYQFEGGQD